AEETDGADVVNVPLGPDFPFGLLVVQDGSNDPQAVALNGDGVRVQNVSANFKLVPWERVAGAFPLPLTVDTQSFDPRNPSRGSVIRGVASGDTTQTSTVLWVSSALAADVTFEVARDAGFTVIVDTKTSLVTEPRVPVKEEVTGLTAGTD